MVALPMRNAMGFTQVMVYSLIAKNHIVMRCEVANCQ